MLRAVAALLAPSAFAYGVAGPRVFVNTLLLDDPAVSDEASLPTFSWQRPPGGDPSNEFDTDFELDKRITKHFGIGFDDGYTLLTTPGEKSVSGWGNLSVTLKYQAYTNAAHETLISIGVIREFARTGSSGLDNDDVPTTTPTVYWGKGLGDLPIGWLRPLALTAHVWLRDRRQAVENAAGHGHRDSRNPGQQRHRESLGRGAAALQYSIPYLQSQVRDLGLPTVLGRLTPLIELAWSSPASHPHALGTQYLFGVGAVYTEDAYALSLEALIPANGQTGRAIGAIAQFHLYLDDLFPHSLGKPLISW